MAKGQMRSNKEAKKPKKDKEKPSATASSFSSTMEKAGAGKGGKK